MSNHSGAAHKSVCLVAPPFRGEHGWVTVPPAGYGGIQWSMANLIDGLLELGMSVTLIGAPGSPWRPDSVVVADVAVEHEIVRWLEASCPALIHDFANFSGLHDSVPAGCAYCRTWQLTSRPPGWGNTVFVSDAQRLSMSAPEAPVIPLPINPDRYSLVPAKDGYLLFLGRISPWKGAYEAAALAAHVGSPLVMAGPSWEPEYKERIVRDFPGVVTFAGEVAGHTRERLLARARALTVLSQPVQGPWGQVWCEPGAAVVAEAAASGTPVIATDNGCLRSLVPGVGVIVSTGPRFTNRDTAAVAGLPMPAQVRDVAITRWGHVAVARRYLAVYADCLAGRRWR